jgi:hypothetical protein
MDKEIENTSYIIRDIMGKIVMNKNISDKTLLNSVDISNLAEGMYILEIMSTNNTKEQFKFNVIK